MNAAHTSWPRRLIGVAVIGLAISFFLTWVGSDPSWFGVLAAVTATASLVWFVTEGSGSLAISGWRSEHPTRTSRPTVDGRLGSLRRLADSAGEPPRPGESHSPSAATLQDLIRRAVEARQRDRPSLDLPTDLVDYLRADPPPIIRPNQLDELLTKVEAL